MKIASFRPRLLARRAAVTWVALLLTAGVSQAGEVQLLSQVAAGGTPTGGVLPLLHLQLSDDGRYTIFGTTSPTVVAGQVDTNGFDDFFLVDRVAGTTTLVSHSFASATTAANGRSFSAALSGDGRWVAFTSSATDLVPGFTGGGGADLYLYDRVTGIITLASHTSSSPTEGSCSCSFLFSFSTDGRYLAYAKGGQIYLYDRVSDTNTLVSHAAGSPTTPGETSSGSPVISRDGNFVVYLSQATDLVPGQSDVNGGYDVFLWERATGVNALVSHTATSPTTAGNGINPLWPLGISSDGRWIAYTSAVSNLIAGGSDSNGQDDVFLYDRTTNASLLVSHIPASPLVAGDGASRVPLLSADGRWVAFSTRATNLVGIPDSNGGYDAVLYDRATGAITLLSHKSGAPNLVGNQETVSYAISADGSTIALESLATDLAPGTTDLNNGYDVLVIDRAGSLAELASRSFASPTTAGNGSAGFQYIALSAAGGVAVFHSSASNLAPGDSNSQPDLFAYVRDFQDYFTLTPCRLLDTRQEGPLVSGAILQVGAHGICGIPATAEALAVNVTVLNATGSGDLALFAGGGIAPGVGTVPFMADLARANNALVRLGPGGSLALQALVSDYGTVDVVVDVAGYFE